MELYAILVAIAGGLLVLIGIGLAGSGLDSSFKHRLGMKMIPAGLVTLVGLILVIGIRHWLKI